MELNDTKKDEHANTKSVSNNKFRRPFVTLPCAQSVHTHTRTHARMHWYSYCFQCLGY